MPTGTRPRNLAAAIAGAALLLGLAPGAVPAEAAQNLGLNRPVTASGQESGFAPTRAFDGDAGPEDPTPPAVHNDPAASRWSAGTADGDSAWIAVDFGAPATLESVEVRWGNTYATSYSLLGSADGQNWSELETELAGARGQWTTVELEADGVQHLKLQIQGKSQEWPLSIWEIEANGELEEPITEPFSVPVVPKPAAAVESGLGEFQLTTDTAVAATGEAIAVAEGFAETLRTSTGFELPVGAAGEVEFLLDAEAGLPAEGYTLTSGSDGVTVTASTQAGLNYGAVTLLQLLGPWARSAEPVAADWTVPGVEITDAPRYEWRGFMLDVSRSFFPKDEVLTMIDQMGQYKLNVLHLHLSDDQGWRIAISNEGRVEGDDIDYTLLTSVGGQTAVEQAAWTDLPGRTGFFTAEDFAEIVAYADARHIAIVPEIDGPAHAQTMLHSIPQLNSENSFPKPAAGEDTAPHNPTTSVGESTLDVHNEYTYMAINHVLGQLVEANSTLVADGRYLHIGGDESFSTSHADYLTYIDRVSDIVTDLDATPMVWNEAANSSTTELPDGTVIQLWNGGLNANAKALVNKRGGKVVLSPASNAYLPQRPGTDMNGVAWACGATGGACGINAFYNWNPTTFAGVPEERVFGVEAPMWGEHTRSLTSIEYMIYPRLMATAEVGWTPQAQRSEADFRERLGAIGASLTIQDRNFYPTDGNWNTDVAPLVRDEVAAEAVVGDIAVASIPRTELDGVSAELVLDGEQVPVEVSVERELAYNPDKFDYRHVNGLFRVTLEQALPAGAHTGTLDVTAHGETVSVPVSIQVAAEDPDPTEEPTEPTEEPTDPTEEPTDEPSEDPTQKPTDEPSERPFSVYTTPGLHFHNGRHWSTTCEAYSVTERCRTEIWATTVHVEGGRFVKENKWVFNNLTYLPSSRSVWADNPLGNEGRWTAADGRQWTTDCDSATTGRNGCRSYTLASVVVSTQTASGWTYAVKDEWVFNNIVLFS
ncbi:family 20 glycosylhydrolase [Tessaracoccus terricola]